MSSVFTIQMAIYIHTESMEYSRPEGQRGHLPPCHQHHHALLTFLVQTVILLCQSTQFLLVIVVVPSQLPVSSTTRHLDGLAPCGSERGCSNRQVEAVTVSPEPLVVG